MNELVLLFTLTICLVAALANLTIWSRRAFWMKMCSLGLVAVFIPIAYLALTELLSRPKPASIEWAQRNVPEAVVISSQMVEERAIYLWLAIEGLDQPRAYSLPWSEELAKQLHRAGRTAESEGSQVKMRQPFDRSILQMDEPIFYANPQTATQPKRVAQGSGPFVFQGRKANSALAD